MRLRAFRSFLLPALFANARATLTSLMAQLILDHAAKTTTPPTREAGHDH